MQAKKKELFKFIFWAIVIICGNIFFSCQNENCVSVFNNDLLVGFIETDTLESGKVLFHSKDTMFFSVTAVGSDSVFYDKNTTLSTFKFPVNPSTEITTFKLEMIDSIRYDTLSLDPIILDTIYYVNPIPHTISVSYDKKLRLISEDCGTEIAYIKLNIEEISFETTILEEDKLSRFNEANIEVYF